MDRRPIGIFDSGLGGLTAVREVLSILPDEEVIYFGDTGRVPYGTRSRETIIKYVRQDMNFLRTFDIKLIIVACGTASTVALDLVKSEYDVPLIGVVGSAVSRAAEVTKNGRIGIIGTTGSIDSGRYEALLKEIAPGVETVSKACPLLVPLVENGRFSKDDPVIQIILREYLQPIIDFHADTLIMGCTHYPLLREAIGCCMGDSVTLVDPGLETVKYVKSLLESDGALGKPGCGKLSFYVTDSVESFARYGGIFLDRSVVGSVNRVDIEKY